ncbi:MAG TPA: FAD:protein FMN transferase ApbE [Methylococcaceae bacterium]|nr:FAD:protein FMN transferase ApbE [Methylococcaceae bacterium]
MHVKQDQRGFGFFLVLVFLLVGCDDQGAKKAVFAFEMTGQTMGTSFSIKASVLPDGVEADQLNADVKELLELVNDQMSTYRPQSELSLINNSDSVEWQSVSEALYGVLAEARRISDLSEGAFDITVGPLVNLWGFGPDPLSFQAPSNESILLAMQRIGYRHLKLRTEPLSVKKNLPDLYLDLSAIAKGYGVDQVGLLFEKQGINDYLVEIGGELRLRGRKPDGNAWRIAIEKPTSEQRMIQKIVSITDISVATSGDYRNFFEAEGVRFSHTIDPRTGRSINHNLASVTVLSETAMEADAWATAFMVLGAEEGLRLAEQQHIPVLFIIKTEKGFSETSTSAFSDYFKE